MTEIQNPKHYDLEERTFKFAKRVIDYVNRLPKTFSNMEIGNQLIRAGASVGANYIEANESLGKKDFAMKIKTSRKEAKESRYWLRLSEPKEEQLKEKELLIQEATELMNIFGAILKKVQ
jgi:four helix bundle protein